MDNIFFLLIFVFVKVNTQTISTPPSDLTTQRGEDVTLSCRVSNGEPDDVNTLEWREYITATTGQLIYNSNYGVIDQFRDKYEVVGTGGNYDLKVINPEVVNGGFYGCSLSMNPDPPARGDLVVLDKPEFVHSSLVEGRYNLIRCLASYGAPTETEISIEQRAKMRVYIEYSGGAEMQEGNFTEITKGVPGPGEEYIPWELMFEVNRTFTASDHGFNITCEIYTEEPYVINELSQQLDVLYPVRNIEIAPRNSYYFVGEYINCTAEGNSEPEISWIALVSEGPRPVDGGYLEISYLMVGYNEWRCTATNYVENTETLSEEFSFEVVPPTEGSSAPTRAQCTHLIAPIALLLCKMLS